MNDYDAGILCIRENRTMIANNFLAGTSCSYQSLTPKNHWGEERLVECRDLAETERSHHKYFEHELGKGLRSLARFEAFCIGWCDDDLDHRPTLETFVGGLERLLRLGGLLLFPRSVVMPARA